MSRKPLPRRLPPLAELHPAFAGFPPHETALHSLTDLLRATIERVREQGPRHFYAQREVARFCRIPQRTVHLAYRQLAAEGLLAPVRSAGTLLLGRKLQPRVPPRGVVGLPIYTRAFALLQYWRSFFIRLEEELRRHEFVGDLVFYGADESADPEFAERLLAHHLDYLIWLYPLPETRPLLARLADGGVRVVTVVDQVRWAATTTAYVTAWEDAYRRALAAWKTAGVTEALLVVGAEFERYPDHGLKRALSHTGLRYSAWSGNDIRELVCGRHTGLLFADDFIHVIHCRHQPEAVCDLMRRARVLMVNGVEIPNPPADLRVDIVRMDWERLARRLASDLAALPPQPTGKPICVKAQWLPRVPAAQFAESF